MSETTKPAYTKPLPDMRPEGDHWWAAMKEHKLLLPTDSSGKPFWYPRALVPGTLEPTQWVEAKGTGTVYTYSIHFIGRRKGSMRRRTSPFWKRRTVPLDWLTTMAMALVARVISAAAQWRVPNPVGSVRLLSRGAATC